MNILGAFSNSCLLIMVVALLGHGLVDIPKLYYKYRNKDE